jgi:hypothetical protein
VQHGNFVLKPEGGASAELVKAGGSNGLLTAWQRAFPSQAVRVEYCIEQNTI